jgi:hypothetical protein
MSTDPFTAFLDLLDDARAPSAAERPICIVRLRPDKNVRDHIKALRWALKRLRRDHGMHCLSAEVEAEALVKEKP